MKQPSGIREIYLHGGVPTSEPGGVDVNWKGPYRVKGGNDPAFTANSTEDGIGRPMGASQSLAQTYELVDLAPYDQLKTWETNGVEIKVAEVKPDGTFRYRHNVECAVRLLPKADKSDFQTVRLYIFGTELLASELSNTNFAG